MTYDNAQSARDAIFDALIFNLKKIDGLGSPYFNPIAANAIFEEEPQVSDITPYPAVVIFSGKEKVKVGAQQTLSKQLEVGLYFYTNSLPPGKSARQWRNSMLEDLEYLIGNNPGLPLSSGAPTCTDATVGDNDPMPGMLEATYVGIGVKIIVEYQQDLKDPSVQT